MIYINFISKPKSYKRYTMTKEKGAQIKHKRKPTNSQGRDQKKKGAELQKQPKNS